MNRLRNGLLSAMIGSGLWLAGNMLIPGLPVKGQEMTGDIRTCLPYSQPATSIDNLCGVSGANYCDVGVVTEHKCYDDPTYGKTNCQNGFSTTQNPMATMTDFRASCYFTQASNSKVCPSYSVIANQPGIWRSVNTVSVPGYYCYYGDKVAKNISRNLMVRLARIEKQSRMLPVAFDRRKL